MKKKVEKKSNRNSNSKTFGLILILAVIILAIFLSYNVNVSEAPPVINKDDQFLSGDFVEICLNKLGLDAIYIAGAKGGYINDPSNQLLVDDVGFTDYIVNGNAMPSKLEIEDEISWYVDKYLEDCTEGLYTGFTTYTEITSDDVAIYVGTPSENYDLYGNIDYYLVPYPIRLGVIYDATNSFINDQLSYGSEECEGCLQRFKDNLDRSGISVETVVEDGVTIYVVNDNEPLFPGYEYSFVFANKYG